MIAGGMGPKAVSLFAEQGIEVICGVSGVPEDVMRDFLAGTSVSGQNTCHHTAETR